MIRRIRDVTVRVLVVTLWLLVAVSSGHADEAEVDQGPIHRRGASDAPRYGVWTHHTNGNYAWSLALKDGEVWAGTIGGVLQWTPSSGQWIRYTAANGLPDNRIYCTQFDAAGRLWVGCGTWNGGVAVMTDDAANGAVWTKFDENDGLVDDFVFTVAIDQAGRKWIGTSYGMSVLNDRGTPSDKSDDRWTAFGEADGLVDGDVQCIVPDGTGVKWIGTDSGVRAFRDGGTPHNKSDDSWISFTTADGLAGNSVISALVDRFGNKWFGTADGLSVLNNGGTFWNKADDVWVTFDRADGLGRDAVQSITIDSADRKWLCTLGGGISVLDDGGTIANKGDDVWVSFESADGLPDQNVADAAIGQGNQVWFATVGDGVVLLDYGGTLGNKADDQWTVYATDDWLPGNEVESVATEEPGLVWAGTFEGLSVFDGLRATAFDTDEVRAIFVDASRRKWLGTTRGVKLLSDGGTPHGTGDDTWTTFNTSDGLVSNWVSNVFVDSWGRVWISTGSKGASLLLPKGTPHGKSDDDWVTFTQADGMASDRVHAAAAEMPNLVWFCHENEGVSVLDHRGTPRTKSDDVWTTFDRSDGLADGSVYSVVLDEDGRKWFGTCEGISVLDDDGTPHNKNDDQWMTFPTMHCNPGLVIDEWGRKWAAEGWRGIYMLDDRGTLYDRSDDLLTWYTIEQGLVDNRTHSIAVGADGTVWVGTDGGLSQLVPVHEFVNLPLVISGG